MLLDELRGATYADSVAVLKKGIIVESNALLDAVKARYNLPSDFALSKKLDVTRQYIGDLRVRGLSEPVALQVATLLDLNPGEVLASIRAERAKNPEVKAVWQKVAESMRSALGMVVAAVLAAFIVAGLPSPAQAAPAFNPEYTLCALRRWLRRFPRLSVAFLGAFALAACGGAAQNNPDPTPAAAPAPAPIIAPTPPAPVSPVLPYTWVGGLVGVWEPTGTPRGVMILHQGHSKFDAPEYRPASLVPVAEQFAAAGLLVYGFEMPPGDHGIDRGPIERFYAPVLNLIDAIPGDLPIYMAGLSGGGWTTTTVTAISPRIVRGYSVAGDAPLDVWAGARDWEQTYFDLRALYAQAGSRLLHIYNFYDPCCWEGISGDTGYAYVTDYTRPANPDEKAAHSISPWAIEFILTDIASITP